MIYVYTLGMNISKILSLLEMKVHYPVRFAFYKAVFKQDKNRFLFADPYSTDLTDNMAPIYTALSKRDGVTLVKCFPKNEGLSGSSFMGKIKGRLNRSNSFNKFIKEYARCGTVFLTESYLPAYAVTPRPGTNVVQLWHGSGAFKKWGYSITDKSFGASKKDLSLIPMHNSYTLVPISSSEVEDHYADAFGCKKDIIKPLGVPRTDELINYKPEKHEGIKILYAPTFRGNNIVSAKSGAEIDIKALKDALTTKFPGCHLLLKMHPFARDKVVIPDDCKGFCLDISDMNTNDALKMADILITDYSSIIFEYSLLNKPIIFYAYDLDAYKDNRDFYYPYEDFVPGPIVKTEEELIDALTNYEDIDLKKVDEFRNKYMTACDGHSTERILKELLI